MDWEPAPRPAELAESRLIGAFLGGQFPIGSSLPPERDLAVQLGITRPTLREALQRLARDGWIEIRHGRPTRICDFWQEGNLGVLAAMARTQDHLSPAFVVNLLEVRISLAPGYTRLAVERAPQAVLELLQNYADLEDMPEAFAAADWHLHRVLTIASANPVFTLILNGFGDLYQALAQTYFAHPQAREHSRSFYVALAVAAGRSDPEAAERLTFRVMAESLQIWQAVSPRRVPTLHPSA